MMNKVNNKFYTYIIKKIIKNYNVSKPDACLILQTIDVDTYMLWRFKFYARNERVLQRILQSNKSYKYKLQYTIRYKNELIQYQKEDNVVLI